MSEFDGDFQFDGWAWFQLLIALFAAIILAIAVFR